jgi:hypothetical protein
VMTSAKKRWMNSISTQVRTWSLHCTWDLHGKKEWATTATYPPYEVILGPTSSCRFSLSNSSCSQRCPNHPPKWQYLYQLSFPNCYLPGGFQYGIKGRSTFKWYTLLLLLPI